MPRFAVRPIVIAARVVLYTCGMINARPTSNAGSESIRPLMDLASERVFTYYRCPVCGEMVDPSNAEEILLHHEHVTHPRDFAVAKIEAA